MSHSQLLVLFLLTVESFSIFGCKEYSQSGFRVDRGDVRGESAVCRAVSTVALRCPQSQSLCYMKYVLILQVRVCNLSPASPVFQHCVPGYHVSTPLLFV